MRLNTIDFDNLAELIKILRKDKDTRIEGLCSEFVFLEDIVKGNLEPVTSGFWFKKRGSEYNVVKLITDMENLSNNLGDLDYIILDFFTGLLPKAPTIVYFNEKQKTFNWFHHVKGHRYDNLNGRGKVLDPRSRPYIKNTDIKKIDKACDFLNERKILKDAAIGRLFANYWLGREAWDIDFFTMTSGGQIVALEVKHKYPTRANTFGLNDGEVNLFCFLKDKGIVVQYVILEKPVKKSAISAVDFLCSQNYIEKGKWFVATFSPEKLWRASEDAPKETSLGGRNRVRYKHISVKEFKQLKHLYTFVSDIKDKLLAGLDDPPKA